MTSAVATPARHAAYLQPVDRGGEQRGEQQRDRDRHDDRGQVRHDDADHVQRGHHHQQPPSQRRG